MAGSELVPPEEADLLAPQGVEEEEPEGEAEVKEEAGPQEAPGTTIW